MTRRYPDNHFPLYAKENRPCQHPMGLRWQARNDPGKLPFSSLCIGNRVKFPRAEIVRYYEKLLMQDA